ncbi:unnamed protein product [Spirodela intermedia]|uniref:Uncharacterized protein n=1 Tax=Spirodela intermedia TaxID=51605 RepID=A0A7I8JPP6_SPIIN|nr:unnamed protein product [Spirodela intermedia]CAA6672149.1 unnamed protein product [Spirodela intermedia]
MRLHDHSAPLQYRRINRMNAPIENNTNFRVDHHLVQMLPHFHGMAHEEPYKHLEDFSQVCEISHYPNVPIETAKMKLFPFTLKDKAKDWLQALAQELNSWSEMEAAFLKKFYSVDKHLGKRIEVDPYHAAAGEAEDEEEEMKALEEVILTKNKGKNKEDYSENLCNTDIIDECANELYIQGISLEVCMHYF